MNSDFKDLLRAFNARGVRYLVVGGYAVIKYTEPRYTKDLDLLISREGDNPQRIMQALRDFGAPLTNVTAEDFSKEGVFYQIGVAPNRIDIITSASGLDFEAAYARREDSSIGDFSVPFIAREDLIDAKLAAGRPQDLVDAGALAKGKKARR